MALCGSGSATQQGDEGDERQHAQQQPDGRDQAGGSARRAKMPRSSAETLCWHDANHSSADGVPSVRYRVDTLRAMPKGTHPPCRRSSGVATNRAVSGSDWNYVQTWAPTCRDWLLGLCWRHTCRGGSLVRGMAGSMLNGQDEQQRPERALLGNATRLLVSKPMNERSSAVGRSALDAILTYADAGERRAGEVCP